MGLALLYPLLTAVTAYEEQVRVVIVLASSHMSFTSTFRAVLIPLHHMTLSASSLCTSLHCLECIVMVYITIARYIRTVGAYSIAYNTTLFHYKVPVTRSMERG